MTGTGLLTYNDELCSYEGGRVGRGLAAVLPAVVLGHALQSQLPVLRHNNYVKNGEAEGKKLIYHCKTKNYC